MISAVNTWLVLLSALCISTYKPVSPITINEFKIHETVIAPKKVSVEKTLTYIRASIPTWILRCMRKLTLVRCAKLFLLQRLEDSRTFANTGNLTKDILDQFVYNNKIISNVSLKKYAKISDAELTKRLTRNLRLFFKGRDIKLHFLPGLLIQVLPSSGNKIKVFLKEVVNEGRRHKSYNKLVQIAVPVMLMPVILLGSFLPFMIPAIKMAAIMSTLMNNGALLAALLYAARTAAMNDEQPVHYSYPGYH